MKLSFSTLGCPEWKWTDILAVARDLGFHGIEIRGIMREMFAPKIKIFDNEHIEQTKRSLAQAGLSIPILTSGAYLSDPSQTPLAEFEVLTYAQLCVKLGIKYVRVMGEKTPEPSGEGSLDELTAEYARFCDLLLPMGVTPLIETNGILADCTNMSRLIEGAGRENSGVLWDVHHTYRYFNESPEYTVGKLGEYIKHVHIKDSYMEGGAVKYALMGYGDVPVADAVCALDKAGYDGFFSYEWVKRWVPELEGSGIAFHSYINYMKEI